MLVFLLLILPVVFVLFTFFVSDKQAKNVALLSSLATLGVGIYAFYQYSLHPECACFIYHTDWVKALNADFYIKMDDSVTSLCQPYYSCINGNRFVLLSQVMNLHL